MKENSRQHCVKVLKLYDWINKVSGIQLKKPINNQKLVTDKICGNFSVSCENNQQLWSVKGKLSVSGSVTVYHRIGSDQLDVIVNGVTVAKVGKGEEIALDFESLKSLELRCSGRRNKTCKGKYCISIFYTLSKFNPKYCHLFCFLSDKDGNPAETLLCEEVSQRSGRTTVEMVHQNGEKVTLQKVIVSKKGYITVQIWQKGKLCKIGTIPFQLVEELILCAPTGTHIECEVTDFMCSAEITKDCINIEIRVCQQVKAVAEAIIEVEADLCQPCFFTESKLI